MFSKRHHAILLSLCFVLSGLSASLKAGWWRTYGGEGYDVGNCVQITSDGNYIISGQKDFDLWLLKVDTSGKVLWDSTYGRSDTRIGRWVEETSDGGYIVAPRTPSLLKVDAQGNTLWSKEYGINSHCVQETSDGGFVFVGEYTELVLAKTDSEGDTLWTRRYSEPGNAYNVGYFIQETDDGGFIVTGVTNYIDPEDYGWSNLWLVKTDSLGNELWRRTYGEVEYDYVSKGHCVRQTNDGGYIITGLAPGGLWLLKTDTLGDTVWTKTYSMPPGGEGYSVQEVQEGGYIIVGTTEAVFAAYHSGLRDLLLLKTDKYGDSLWARVYGDDEGSEIGYCVQQTENNGYIVTGVRHGDLYLLKTDSLGLLAVAEEPATESLRDWDVIHPVGRQIILRYTDCPNGFQAFIFDALGRKVDELRGRGTSGTITWGEKKPSGVYFIRGEDKLNTVSTAKVVLVD